MQKTDSTSTLSEAIQELETRKVEEGRMLKEHVNHAYESIKPLNLIKSSLKEALANQEVRGDLRNLSLGVIAGYVSKKVFSGMDDSPVKKLLTNSLQLGITLFILNNQNTIEAIEDKIKSFFGNDDEDQ